MKNIFLGLALTTLCAVSLSAQTQTAVVLSPLVQSQQFLNRVQYQIVLAAPAIETESASYTPAAGDTHPSTTVCHSARARLAAAIAASPANYAAVFAEHLITSSNVSTAGAPTGSTASGTYDSPATDAALFSAVNAMWSDISGCLTNP